MRRPGARAGSRPGDQWIRGPVPGIGPPPVTDPPPSRASPEAPPPAGAWRIAAKDLPRQLGPPALRLARQLPRWILRVALGFALASALLIGVLRWVDPPTSAFMAQHAIKSWLLGRKPPHYYHSWVPWSRIPPAMPLAAIAAEDQRFPFHHGFDPVEIRHAIRAWRTTGQLRGASTISQQTAKNLFLWPGRNWLRKSLEAWFTALIELLWPKKRILEVYLNIVQFSASTYGVGAASERYFHRPADELTLSEAALLAGVLPSPSAYRLDRPSLRLHRRAAWVLDQTQRLGGSRYLRNL
jgi:monofunctional biosynthetic peptidoglycan transglycosylase